MKNLGYKEEITDLPSILESLPTAMFTIDKAGNFCHYNQNWLLSTGLLEGEVKSLKDLDTADHIIAEKIVPMLEQIFSGNKPKDVTVFIVHRTNRKKKCFKLSGNQLNEKWAVFAATDVTDEIKLR